MKGSTAAHTYLSPLVLTLQQAVDPKRAQMMSAYLLHQFEFLGIAAPQRDQIVFSFLHDHPCPNLSLLTQAVKTLWQMPEREFQYAAIDLMAQHHKLWQADAIELLEDCLVKKSWWDTVDGLNSDCLHRYYQKFPKQLVRKAEEWNKSNNIWLIRCSILFQKKCKAATQTDVLSAHILSHTHSPEFFVQKAIGWALREYGKTNPAWVKAFVAQNKMAPLSKREALKRL